MNLYPNTAMEKFSCKRINGSAAVVNNIIKYTKWANRKGLTFERPYYGFESRCFLG